MRRVVEPELLDHLPPADRQAVHSRADLRRLNFIMGHAGILARALDGEQAESISRSRPLRLVELGAGDGTLLFRLARRRSALGITAQITLLDQQDLVSAETRRAFALLNWSVESVKADVFTWLGATSSCVDMVVANLFLHHLPVKELRALLRLVAARTNLFIACEPRRSWPALAASRLLWFIGCNATTRHDALVSVRAGFVGHELSALWPAENEWQSCERSAGCFSHCFVATRNA